MPAPSTTSPRPTHPLVDKDVSRIAGLPILMISGQRPSAAAERPLADSRAKRTYCAGFGVRVACNAHGPA